MRHPHHDVTRRTFLATGGLGALAAAAPGRALAAQPSAVEQANIAVVDEFCAAFVAPIDWDRITSFLSADCKYRATQTTPVAEGHQAIEDLLKGFVESATSVEFELVWWSMTGWTDSRCPTESSRSRSSECFTWSTA